MKSNINWSLNSWEKCKISQQPKYLDNDELKRHLDKLSKNDKNATNFENIHNLKDYLVEVSQNKSLVLIAGDCSESFSESDCETVKLKCAFLNLLGTLLQMRYKKKVVLIGRLAGQYAKPRTVDQEEIEGVFYPSYKGDNVNCLDLSKRQPDPNKLTEGYETANKVKDYINVWNQEEDQSRSSESIEDLLWFKLLNSTKLNFKNCFSNWISNHNYSINENEYEGLSQIVVDENEDQMDKIKYKKLKINEINNNSKIFTCHEGLLLNLEASQTRLNISNNKHYTLSADMLWIGERTNKIDEAHVEFFRGIENAIGIKVSSKTNIDDLIEIIKRLNPQNSEGKILLNTRIGMNTEGGKEYLNNLASKLKNSALNFILLSDPMHGNTQKMGNFKIRKLDDLISEIDFTAEIFSNYDISLNGIHLESTPFDVTECIDSEIEEVIDKKYTSLCDPRLNFNQSCNLIMQSNIVLNKEK